MSVSGEDDELDDLGGVTLADGSSQAVAAVGISPDHQNLNESVPPSDLPASDSGSGDDYEEEALHRFPGPASTWRHYTRDERGLAASLDQQRANDLSVHLYNAHALKSRLYRFQDLPAPWRGKHQWRRGDLDEQYEWQPDRDWTSWPLLPDDIPRPEEKFGVPPLDEDDGDLMSKPTTSWLPSQDIQAEIQALLLRRANVQFRERVPDVASSIGPSNAGETKSPGSGLTDEGTKSLQSNNGLAENLQCPPTLLTDDDEAHAILQPTVRHITAKLDALLLGLHQSREGHRVLRSAANTSKDQSEEIEDSPPRNPEVLDEETTRAGRPRSSTRRQRTRSRSLKGRHALGERDWSEVLGIASLVGWDPQIIERAASRCATLFGESMTFRTMSEYPHGQLEDDPAETMEDAEVGSPDEPRPVEPYPFCPVESCARHLEAFTTRWRWREHLKRLHSIDPANYEQQTTESSEDPAVVDVDEDSETDAEPLLSVQTGPDAMYGGVHVDGFMQPVLIDFESSDVVKHKRIRHTVKRRKFISG